MNRLWAPWREGYLSKIDRKHQSCVFCRIMVDSRHDKEHLVFIRKAHSFAVLNLYPYSNGHCLILPNRHVSDISKLPKAEYVEVMELLIEAKGLIDEVYKPHGFNVGINLGRLAGAGIPGHVHIHLVPRWKGDHNFMAVTAQTKVISQSITGIYKKLSDAYKKRNRSIRK